MCDRHEEFQKLLAEFEAVANEAGSLVHTLLFSIDRGIGKMDVGFAVVLYHIDHLKGNIMKFLNLMPFIYRSAYLTPKTLPVESLLIVDSLIYVLNDLMDREDNPTADVKDQIKILHQGLIFLQSSIKDIGSTHPSKIGELKEPLMRIGDMAHETEYLIIFSVAGDVPFWYLNRLADIYQKIKLIGIELQEMTKKYKVGGLKVAEYFIAKLLSEAKRNGQVDDIAVGFEDNATDILGQLVRGTESLQLISIFGMAGLGKTTSTKELYKHPLVINYCFHLTRELNKDLILKMEEESLLEYIYKALKGRMYPNCNG